MRSFFSEARFMHGVDAETTLLEYDSTKSYRKPRPEAGVCANGCMRRLHGADHARETVGAVLTPLGQGWRTPPSSQTSLRMSRGGVPVTSVNVV